jgi:hypothetical protein
MPKAVLLHEEYRNHTELELNIEPSKNEIFKLLGGPATFIGQWPDIEVVIVKNTIGGKDNLNKLPKPFETEKTCGKILLVRMDEDSEQRDFTLRDYRHFVRGM